MKEYRDDVRARARAAGRDPDDIKLLFTAGPVIAPTKAEAEAKLQRILSHPSYVESQLVGIASNTEIDFSRFDLDEPLPRDLTTNGEQSSLQRFMEGDASGKAYTLRELTMLRARRGLDLVGTPQQVARKMAEVMEEVGGDGFLITKPGWNLTRSYISDICDGLVPELQRLGVVRTQYGKSTLRETLREF
jgi:alkanesulfonate monooxygenase SsuD/methylene tetrahydromethanopterin reductase-like flavin-dependent oxidoreductase (luciferase family)